MKQISIDIETYSSVDLTKCGVYKYSESEDFKVLLFAYSVDGGEINVVDLANGENISEDIITALSDENVTKWAFNANFERVCLSRFFGLSYADYLSPKSWRCSQVWATFLGLPQTLKDVGAVLNLDKQKMDEGKDLIKFFCCPNKSGERNLPADFPDKWKVFKAYNKRDVEVEMAIQSRLAKFPVPDFIWDEYHLDQIINDRGIAVDMRLVDNAILLDELSKSELSEKLKSLTNLENPNSVTQLKEWFTANNFPVESLGKKEIAEYLKTACGAALEVLKLRQRSARSSVKKYAAMRNSVCKDGRVRGMFKFYGANRTGRFSSKIVQLQNLPQNHLPDLEQARDLVKCGDFDALEMLYDDIPDTLSQLIRTAFVPETEKFIVADFAAIEARVIAWLSGESWRLKAFANGEDIYCASASKMFGVRVVKHGENGHLRQKGKIAELALGYGGSVGALKAMGALEMGLQEDELQDLVDSWRAANPHITALWWSVDRAVKQAIKERSRTETHGIKFIYQSGFLFIELPSKRRLVYVKPKIGENRFGGESVTYMGIGANKKWARLESYGPKFVENIVQAISRDLLVNAMRNLSEKRIVAHIHDELIIECGNEDSLEKICREMARTPTWGKGLLLRADGYECGFYKKD